MITGRFMACVLAAGLLGGCADRTEAYCETLRDEQQVLRELADNAGRPGDTALQDGLVVFGRLRDEAPDDLRDEWDTYYFAWEGLVDAFREAGVPPRDYRPGRDAAGVSASEEQAIADAAGELASPRVLDAGQGIQQHARDVCDVDLAVS